MEACLQNTQAPERLRTTYAAPVDVSGRIPLTMDTLLETLDRVGLGAAVLNGQGDVLGISLQGRQLLKQKVCLSGFESKAEWLRQATARLIVNDVSSLPNETGGQLGLYSGDDCQLAIRIAPMCDGDKNGHGKLIMMLLIDLEAASQPNPATLKRIFGLTAAEAEIALRIGRGETLKQMARERGVSVPTLRSQLAAVFAKTSTRRQTELAILLTRCTILLGPCDSHRFALLSGARSGWHGGRGRGASSGF